MITPTDKPKHVTNGMDECVHYCPACGPVCEHGANSYECDLCAADEPNDKPPADMGSEGMGVAVDTIDDFIGGLLHDHCSWDVPGGCDGVCDCHVEGVQRSWQRVRLALANVPAPDLEAMAQRDAATRAVFAKVHREDRASLVWNAIEEALRAAYDRGRLDERERVRTEVERRWQASYRVDETAGEAMRALITWIEKGDG